MKLICTALFFIMAIAIIEEINLVEAEDESSSQEPDFFECADGKYVIPNESMCDGQVDCDDESDESDETCQDITCEEDAFRCKYGACVGKESLCDKVDDCRDKSDETDESCKDK